jgi:hypothetical protein
MTAAALHPFVAAMERDWPLFNVAQVAASQMRGSVLFLLRVLLFLPIVILAQFVPFIFRRHLALLIPRLPDVHNPADLAWVKDALVLYYESIKAYSPFCVFRGQMREMLDEVDEQLDSLEFAASHKEFLDKATAQIEQQ